MREDKRVGLYHSETRTICNLTWFRAIESPFPIIGVSDSRESAKRCSRRRGMSKFRGRRLPFVQVARRWSLARECGVACTFSILLWIFLTTIDLDISRIVSWRGSGRNFNLLPGCFSMIFKEAGGKRICRGKFVPTSLYNFCSRTKLTSPLGESPMLKCVRSVHHGCSQQTATWVPSRADVRRAFLQAFLQCTRAYMCGVLPEGLSEGSHNTDTVSHLRVGALPPIVLPFQRFPVLLLSSTVCSRIYATFAALPSRSIATFKF